MSNKQKKSIDIGEFLIVLDGKGKLWIYNDNGEGMNLTKESIKKLEMVLGQFFNENF